MTPNLNFHLTAVVFTLPGHFTVAQIGISHGTIVGELVRSSNSTGVKAFGVLHSRMEAMERQLLWANNTHDLTRRNKVFDWLNSQLTN